MLRVFLLRTIKYYLCNGCNQVEINVKKGFIGAHAQTQRKMDIFSCNMDFGPMGGANQCLLRLTANNAYHEEYTIIRLSARLIGLEICVVLRRLYLLVVLLRELSSM